MHAAAASYAHTYLTVEIYDVIDVTDGGSVDTGAAAINADNEITFKVRVHNSGPLDVLDLTLAIEAEGGATGVKLHSEELTIGARQWERLRRSNVATAPIGVVRVLLRVAIRTLGQLTRVSPVSRLTIR